MDYLGIRTDLILFLITFVITFVLYPIWINFVYRFQMGEVSRVHEEKQGVPTMGGFVFVFTVTIVTILLNRSRNQTLFPIFIATSMGLLGMVEDFSKVYRKSGLSSYIDGIMRSVFRKPEETLKERTKHFLLKPWYAFKDFSETVGSTSDSGLATYQKFIIQGLLAGFVAYWTYFKLGWDYIWMPLLGNIHIGFLYPIFVFLLFICVLNAVAFTDGLDGLAGGLSLFAFLSF